jgi:2-oxoglutarate ferredoxin oxidoreductase subunit gamma
MEQTYEIILAGTGGQGLVTSGIMLAEAGILDGKNALQTQSYGVAQRGGFSSAEVILSTEEILYQKVEHPDVLIVLNDDAVSRYTGIVAPVLYDSSLMKHYSNKGWYGLPFYQMAMKLGSAKMANLVAIGAMIAKVPVVSFDSMAQVIRKKFKPELAVLNIKAMQYGFDAVTAGKGE